MLLCVMKIWRKLKLKQVLAINLALLLKESCIFTVCEVALFNECLLTKVSSAFKSMLRN